LFFVCSSFVLRLFFVCSSFVLSVLKDGGTDREALQRRLASNDARDCHETAARRHQLEASTSSRLDHDASRHEPFIEREPASHLGRAHARRRPELISRGASAMSV